MRQFLVPVFITLQLITAGAQPAEPAATPGAEVPAKDAPKEAPAAKVIAPVVKESTVTIDGKKVAYKVTTGKLQLKEDDGKARASIFHVSYERTDTKDASIRPVMFAFNGGPGSSFPATERSLHFLPHEWRTIR
jgi:carboxypeptidase C (cathepsin A)